VSDERCECCDLLMASCGKAVEARQSAERAAERQRIVHLPGVVPAQYPGVCGDCGERFKPGTLLRSMPPAGWRAECCL
jgi:hypothetical protein